VSVSIGFDMGNNTRKLVESDIVVIASITQITGKVIKSLL